MKTIFLISTIIFSVFLNTEGFLFASDKWDDLKVTWGVNPFGSENFVSLPRTEQEAIGKGWAKEKSCGQVNGNRYVLKGDRAVMLIFAKSGLIAGIASAIPKGLPFNFPSAAQQQYLNDEGDVYTISAYFTDPSKVCSAPTKKRQLTGDRLIIKSNQKEINVALKESDVSSFWTKGMCFITMGRHYWANLKGGQVNENMDPADFLPVFLLYNSGKLNGFGWAFNADLSSSRYEHPDKNVLGLFFNQKPQFFNDPSKSGTLSTMHIYLDSTPRYNFC